MEPLLRDESEPGGHLSGEILLDLSGSETKGISGPGLDEDLREKVSSSRIHLDKNQPVKGAGDLSSDGVSPFPESYPSRGDVSYSEKETVPLGPLPEETVRSGHYEKRITGYHISKFSRELKTVPIPLMMIETLELTMHGGIMPSPLPGRAYPTDIRTDQDTRSYSTEGESEQRIPRDEVSSQALAQEESKTREHLPPSQPWEGEAYVSRTGRPLIERYAGSYPVILTGLYLPAIAAQASIPITRSTGEKSISIARYPHEVLPATPGTTPHQAQGTAAITEKDIFLDPQGSRPQVLKIPREDTGERYQSGILLEETYRGVRQGEEIKLDENQILKKEDIGIEETPASSPASDIQLDNQPGGSSPAGVSLTPVCQTDTVTQSITEDKGVPIIFGVAPLMFQGATHLLRRIIDYPRAMSYYSYPSISPDKVEKLYPSPIYFEEKEEKITPQIIEDISYSQSTKIEMDAREEWRYTLPPMVMLGSAVRQTLPSWVNEVMRCPGFIPVASSEHLIRQKGPTTARTKEGGTGMYRVSDKPEGTTYPFSSMGAEIKEGESQHDKGMRHRGSKGLDERDVVRIVKEWMEEEAKRKGFL